MATEASNAAAIAANKAAVAAANPTDLAAYTAAMQASSGLSIKQLAEQKAEFDATMAQKQAELQATGIPQLAINKQLADLETAKLAQLTQAANFGQNLQTAQLALDTQIQQGNLSIAQAKQTLDSYIQSGQLQVAQDAQKLAERIQTGQLAVSQGQLGLDTLKTAASLSGPADWLKSQAYSRGVSNLSNVPTFVGDLLSGRSTGVLPGAAAGAVVPGANTLQSMATNMGATVPATTATAPVATAPTVTPTTVDPNADPAARAAALTAQANGTAVATPTVTTPAVAAPAGFYTQIAGGGNTYVPSATETAAAGTAAPTSTAGMDAQHMAAFYAAAVAASNAQAATATATPGATAADVASAFGAATPTTTPTTNATDDATAAMLKLYGAGGQSLAPGALEGLTATEKSMLTGGIDTAGGDSSTYLDAYNRSRVAQSAAKPSAVGAG